MTKYGVMISTGNGPFRWVSGGWDAEYATRAEAEAAKKRADAQEGWRAKVVQLPARTLSAEIRHDTTVVRDSEGGVWWPGESAALEIESSSDREATAIRICRDEPMRGTWAS